jgi:putative flippase GtrA
MKKISSLLGIKNKTGLGMFVKQFLKYVIIGISNTIISLSIYYSLLFIGIYYIVASVFSFIISVSNALFWNKKFVFKDSKKSIVAQIVRVYAAYGFSLILGTGTLIFMVEVLGISEFIAPFINICITVPINFFVSKFWAFK